MKQISNRDRDIKELQDIIRPDIPASCETIRLLSDDTTNETKLTKALEDTQGAFFVALFSSER